MFNWLKKLIVKEQAERVTFLYHIVLAIARIQHIHPEVLSQEVAKTADNEEYASKVLLKGGKNA